MKTRSLFLAVLVSAVLTTAAILPVPAAAWGTGTFSIEQTRSASVSQIGSATLYMDNTWTPLADDLWVTVNWDGAVLGYVSMDWMVENSVSATLNGTNSLFLKMTDSANRYPNGKVAIAEINFKGMAAGVSPLTISVGHVRGNFDPYGMTIDLTDSATSVPGTFIVQGDITLTGISPTAGARGSTITADISGTGFGAVPYIELWNGVDSIPAAGVTVINQTSIHCTFSIPSAAPMGTYSVYLRKPGTSDWVYLYNGFTILETLRVTGISPAATARGTTIDTYVSGAGFAPTPYVELWNGGDSIPATAVTLINSSTLRCRFTIPLSVPTGTYSVYLQNPGMTNWVYLYNGFTISGPSLITGCAVITQPGEYLLANDILNSDCPTAIDIRCSNVVLDGQGHWIDGRDIDWNAQLTYGIKIGAEPYAAITNVQVRNVLLTDWGSAGLYATGCSNSVFSGITAKSAQNGIVFTMDCHDNVLSSCTATDNIKHGVEFTDDCSATLNGCTITGNGADGVYGDTSSITCRDSLIAGNGVDDGGDGFDLSRAGGNFYNNTIRHNYGAGLHFQDNVSGTIAGNTIVGNAIGISDYNFQGEGGYRTIYNNFFNNTVNTNANLPNTWSIVATIGRNIAGGPRIGGNYWAQPDGNGFSQTHADANADGFCDVPYTVTPASGGLAAGIDQLPLSSRFLVRAVPGGSSLPTDTNADGKYEDVNGNGRKDFADVVLYFNQMSWIAANEPVSAFDYNGNGRIDFADVVWLFNHL